MAAQTGGNSPFSAYGLGEVVGNTQVPQLLMGGVSVASTDPAGISPINPASYCSLRKTTFETSVVTHLTELSSDGATEAESNTRFLGFSLAIPWRSSRWALALGLLPVTSVGYDITDEGVLSNGVDYRHTYEGTGGLNRAYAGLAHTIWRAKPDSAGRLQGQLTIGGNFNFLFGSIDQTRKAIYPPSEGYTNLSTYSGLVLSGVTGNFGLQYSNELISMQAMKRRRVAKEVQRKAEHDARLAADPGASLAAPAPVRMPEAPWRYVIGLTTELPSDLTARRELLELSFVLANGVETIRDTNYYEEGRKGTLFIPPSFGAGLQAANERWSVQLDVRRRDWSGLQLQVDDYALPSQLRPSMSVQTGASFRPARDRDRSYLKRVIYRAGFRYTSDYLKVGDLQLNEMAVSGGFSLPLSEGNYLSRFHVGAVAGRRGDNDGGVAERFATFYFGLTLTPNTRERWFSPYRIE